MHRTSIGVFNVAAEKTKKKYSEIYSLLIKIKAVAERD